MANDDAWQAGIDIATKNKKKKEDKKKNSQGSNGKGSSGSSGSSSSGPLGGLQSTIKSLMGFGGGSTSSSGTGKSHKKKGDTGTQKDGTSKSDNASPKPDKFTMSNPPTLGQMHSGGKVKKTGNYRLRKKEIVLTATQAKAAGIKGAKGKKKSVSRKRISSKR
jgi:hypothetical protein